MSYGGIDTPQSVPPCQRLNHPRGASQRGSPFIFAVCRLGEFCSENRMPFDPVTALRQIQKRIDVLRMKPAWIAGAGEFSRSILSEAASGQSPLTYPISRKIETTLDACEVLQQRAGEIPID